MHGFTTLPCSGTPRRIWFVPIIISDLVRDEDTNTWTIRNHGHIELICCEWSQRFRALWLGKASAYWGCHGRFHTWTRGTGNCHRHRTRTPYGTVDRRMPVVWMYSPDLRRQIPTTLLTFWLIFRGLSQVWLTNPYLPKRWWAYVCLLLF